MVEGWLEELDKTPDALTPEATPPRHAASQGVALAGCGEPHESAPGRPG